jgi:hypothetical protein
MICIHPDRKTCDDAIKAYKNRLIDLNLVPHDFEDNLVNKADSYWSSKSKSAYRWSSDLNIAKAFPWIGFVGYELHFNGSLRVRKSSLKKEVRKQKEIVDSISQSIDKGRHKQNPGYILESARNRLNGMAVGRIQMWNHSAVDAEMCWVNGFTELNDNPTLKKQLKYLDNRRNYQIAILKKKLKDLGSVKVNRTSKTRKYPYYGRPYSYYYQTLKNK